MKYCIYVTHCVTEDVFYKSFCYIFYEASYITFMYTYCKVKTITVHIVHIGLPIINYQIKTFKIFFFFYFQQYILLIKDIKSNPIYSTKSYLLNFYNKMLCTPWKVHGNISVVNPRYKPWLECDDHYSSSPWCQNNYKDLWMKMFEIGSRASHKSLSTCVSICW